MAKIVGGDRPETVPDAEVAFERQQDQNFIEDLQTRGEPEQAPESRQRVERNEPEAKEDDAPKVNTGASDKRQAIADKLKAQRAAMDKNPERVDIPDAMERLQAGPNVKTRVDRNREAEEAANPQQEQRPAPVVADIPPPVKRQLKVNGQTIEVDEDQLTALAQRAAASDSILEEAKLERAKAKQRLEEIERLQADHSRTRPDESETQQSKAEDTKPATDDELDAIIDQLQFGDKADAAKALRTYGDQILARARTNAADTEALVKQTLDNERVRVETVNALDSFMSENTDFSSSQKRMNVLVDETLTVMENNLLSIGVTKEKLDEYGQAYGLPPSVALSTVYRRLRSEGYKLPDQSAVLKSAAVNVRREFGMPDPTEQRRDPPAPRQVPDNSNFVAERTARKQAIIEQPRRANIAPAELPTQPANTEESRNASYRKAIASMRQLRRGR